MVHRVSIDLGVLDVAPDGLVCVEVAPDVTVKEVLARTGAPVTVALTS